MHRIRKQTIQSNHQKDKFNKVKLFLTLQFFLLTFISFCPVRFFVDYLNYEYLSPHGEAFSF